MGAGDSGASYVMEVPEDLTVTGIRMPMENRFSDLLTVEDGEGQPLTFPKTYQKGDTLSVETDVFLTEKDNRAHMVIHVVPVLEMETAEGEEVCAYLYSSMHYTPVMNIIEIYRIMHMKGDI
ncbi:unknown [Clostridium sp. CAG:505]|nr:unknown [Clostridium sp. CAG:505]